MKSSSQSGFALPTVLIAGIVMMIVLMTALVAASGGRANFDSQYYARIAREAAESGALYAQECMVSHDYEVPWSGDDLHTGQDCDASGAESYMIESDDYRVKYVVADMPNEPDQNLISVTGYVERTRRSSGAVWRTYEYKLNMRASSETSAQRVAFGYYWADPDVARGAHFGVLTSAGDVVGVGNNWFGQLGIGTTANVLTPQSYLLPLGVKAASVFTNHLSVGLSMYVVSTEGNLYGSGRNGEGMLTGNPIGGYISTPRLITFPAGEEVGTANQVVYVSNIYHATYAVLSNGNVYASGWCDQDRLGLGSSVSCSGNRNTMTMVALSGQKAISPVVGDWATAFVITEGGRVYGWGRNTEGMLGSSNPNIGSSTSTPKRIGNFGNGSSGSNSPAKSISTDGETVYILTEAGQVYALGRNTERQITNSSPQARYSTPTLVVATGCTSSPSGSPIIDVKTDQLHVAVLTADGRVCTAGRNSNAQLGRGSASSYRVFGRVTTGLPTGFEAASIWVNSIDTNDSGRMNNTFIVGRDGSVYGMGSNYYGQLGNGTSGSNATYPVRMNIFGSESGRTPAASVLSGHGTTLIFAQNGRIYAVGDNRSGQLGDGTTTNSPTPRATRFLNIGSPSYF